MSTVTTQDCERDSSPSERELLREVALAPAGRRLRLGGTHGSRWTNRGTQQNRAHSQECGVGNAERHDPTPPREGGRKTPGQPTRPVEARSQ